MSVKNDLKQKVNVIKKKKALKRNNLFNAAYELFIIKGINNTAIDDIVKKAGVAKGTFYLYFKDKYDIVDKIILEKSAYIIEEAFEETEKRKDEFSNFVDKTIFFIDYIIEYLKDNRLILKFLYKNLSRFMYKNNFLNNEKNVRLKTLVDDFIISLKENNYTEDEAKKTLFIIVELTSSICYSSIILEEPDTIDNMKPELLKTIRKILNK